MQAFKKNYVDFSMRKNGGKNFICFLVAGPRARPPRVVGGGWWGWVRGGGGASAAGWATYHSGMLGYLTPKTMIVK